MNKLKKQNNIENQLKINENSHLFSKQLENLKLIPDNFDKFVENQIKPYEESTSLNILSDNYYDDYQSIQKLIIDERDKATQERKNQRRQQKQRG